MLFESPLKNAFGGGPWSLLTSRDNDVYVDPTRLVKVARHPDGRERLRVGIETAKALHEVGVAVVEPLSDEVRGTGLGPATM